MQLWVKNIIAMVLGIIAGVLLKQHAQFFKPVGEIFLNLISMVIVLLVLASMTLGVTSIHDPKKLGRVGLKTLAVYLTTTMIAIGLGLVAAHLFTPGSDLHWTAETKVVEINEAPSIGTMLLSVIPNNPVAALVESNVLQIIVFAIFLGIAINFAGEKGKPLLHLMDSLCDVMYRMTSIVMEFSPYGVFAIMASVIGSYGIEALYPLLKFLTIYYVTCLVHALIVFCPILYFMAGLHPLPFFKGMRDAISVAFSTNSSSAALPVTMHCVQENLGVSKNISNFVLPLGSTVNMNGAAIFQGMSALFVAQAYGIELDLTSQITIVVTAALSAIGAAGIPGSGFIMLSVVFRSVGLPIEGMALLAGIDRIREMMSTVINILGDAVTAVYIAKLEGEIDERQYYHEVLADEA